MSKLSKCMTVMVAGLVMSTGAYAQEIDAPANNLGVATISAAQSEAGFLGIGATATGAVMIGAGVIVLSQAVSGFESDVIPPVAIERPDTSTPFHSSPGH